MPSVLHWTKNAKHLASPLLRSIVAEKYKWLVSVYFLPRHSFINLKDIYKFSTFLVSSFAEQQAIVYKK